MPYIKKPPIYLGTLKAGDHLIWDVDDEPIANIAIIAQDRHRLTTDGGKLTNEQLRSARRALPEEIKTFKKYYRNQGASQTKSSNKS